MNPPIKNHGACIVCGRPATAGDPGKGYCSMGCSLIHVQQIVGETERPKPKPQPGLRGVPCPSCSMRSTLSVRVEDAVIVCCSCDAELTLSEITERLRVWSVLFWWVKSMPDMTFDTDEETEGLPAEEKAP